MMLHLDYLARSRTSIEAIPLPARVQQFLDRLPTHLSGVGNRRERPIRPIDSALSGTKCPPCNILSIISTLLWYLCDRIKDSLLSEEIWSSNLRNAGLLVALHKQDSLNILHEMLHETLLKRLLGISAATIGLIYPKTIRLVIGSGTKASLVSSELPH